MKRYVFSKENLIPHSSFLIMLGIVLGLSFASCNRVDEIDFVGTVVEARQCSASYMENKAVYLVQLESPDSIGGTYQQGNLTLHNVVALYEPTRIIYNGDHLRGSFYLEKDAGRLYCSIHWTDINVPEGVFTSVKVD